MYRRIVLAYDGSLEGRNALREGAMLATGCQAEVFLLSVAAIPPVVFIGNGTYGDVVALMMEKQEPVFAAGLARLRELGLRPKGRLVGGQPVQEIAAYARECAADLVVVGHRRRSPLGRWWAGIDVARLADHVGCSVLVARSPPRPVLVAASGAI